MSSINKMFSKSEKDEIQIKLIHIGNHYEPLLKLTTFIENTEEKVGIEKKTCIIL